MSEPVDRSLLNYDSLLQSFWMTPAGQSAKMATDLLSAAGEFVGGMIDAENPSELMDKIGEGMLDWYRNASLQAGHAVKGVAESVGLAKDIANGFVTEAYNWGKNATSGNDPFWSGMFNATAGVLMSGPAYELINNKQNAIHRPKILSPQELWAFAMRGYGKGLWDEYSPQTGYSDSQLEAIKRNYSNTTTLEMIQLGKANFGWKADKVDSLLKHMGYPVGYEDDNSRAITATARLATEQPLGLNDIIELERRGKNDDGVLDANLALMGYEEFYRNKLADLVERTPDPNQVRELFRRGLLPQDRAIELASWMGWPKDVQDKWINLSKTILSPFEYREHFLRGYLNEDQFRKGLQSNGIMGADQTNFVKASFTPPTPSDLVRMGVREVFTPDVVKEFKLFSEFPKDIIPWGRKVGLSEEVLKLHWGAHWDLPSPTQGYEMLHRGVINRDQLKLLLRTKDYMPYWRDKLIDISYRVIPWRLILKLAEAKVFDINDAGKHFGKLGYTPEDSKKLGEYIQHEWNLNYNWPTMGQLIELYAEDKVPKKDIETLLDLLNYQGAKRKYYLRVAEQKKEANLELALKADDPADVSSAKTSAKTKVLEGLRKGILVESEAKNMLIELGYSEEASSFYVISAELDRNIWFQEQRYRIIEDEFMKGAIDRAKAVAKLDSSGYNVSNANEIADLWVQEKQARESIDRANPRQPTKADLRDWFEKGLIDGDKWIAGMEKLGYDEDTSVLYLTEMLLDMQER